MPGIYDSSILLGGYCREYSKALDNFKIKKDNFYFEKLERMEVDEFVDDDYKTAILFNQALESMGYPLPLYHTETGLPILGYEKEIERVYKIKKAF